MSSFSIKHMGIEIRIYIVYQKGNMDVDHLISQLIDIDHGVHHVVDPINCTAD